MDKIGNITLYNADCMEVMKSFSDKEFDLAIVDPPYGINMDGGVIGISRKAKNVEYEKKDWDATAPDESYFKELMRVSKNQIIFGANHFISRIPFDSSCWIVWNKENGSNPFADCELAWTSFRKAVRMFTFRWQGMLQGNMKNKEVRFHPTQKPVQLYGWILNNFAQPGMRILDTHGGSMSSMIACHRGGYEATCIEMDKTYYDKAKKRLQEEVMQGSLFIPNAEQSIKEVSLL